MSVANTPAPTMTRVSGEQLEGQQPPQSLPRSRSGSGAEVTERELAQFAWLLQRFLHVFTEQVRVALDVNVVALVLEHTRYDDPADKRSRRLEHRSPASTLARSLSESKQSAGRAESDDARDGRAEALPILSQFSTLKVYLRQLVNRRSVLVETEFTGVFPLFMALKRGHWPVSVALQTSELSHNLSLVPTFSILTPFYSPATLKRMSPNLPAHSLTSRFGRRQMNAMLFDFILDALCTRMLEIENRFDVRIRPLLFALSQKALDFLRTAGPLHEPRLAVTALEVPYMYHAVFSNVEFIRFLERHHTSYSLLAVSPTSSRSESEYSGQELVFSIVQSEAHETLVVLSPADEFQIGPASSGSRRSSLRRANVGDSSHSRASEHKSEYLSSPKFACFLIDNSPPNEFGMATTPDLIIQRAAPTLNALRTVLATALYDFTRHRLWTALSPFSSEPKSPSSAARPPPSPDALSMQRIAPLRVHSKRGSVPSSHLAELASVMANADTAEMTAQQYDDFVAMAWQRSFEDVDVTLQSLLERLNAPNPAGPSSGSFLWKELLVHLTSAFPGRHRVLLLQRFAHVFVFAESDKEAEIPSQLVDFSVDLQSPSLSIHLRSVRARSNEMLLSSEECRLVSECANSVLWFIFHHAL